MTASTAMPNIQIAPWIAPSAAPSCRPDQPADQRRDAEQHHDPGPPPAGIASTAMPISQMPTMIPLVLC